MAYKRCFCCYAKRAQIDGEADQFNDCCMTCKKLLDSGITPEKIEKVELIKK